MQDCLNYNGHYENRFLLHKIGIVSEAFDLKDIIDRRLSSEGQEVVDSKVSMADLHPAEIPSNGSDGGEGVAAELAETVLETAIEVLEMEAGTDDLFAFCANTDNDRDKRDRVVTILTDYWIFIGKHWTGVSYMVPNTGSLMAQPQNDSIGAIRSL
jgi:hypothetical protein